MRPLRDAIRPGRLVGPRQLPVVPAGPPALDELERHALLRLGADHPADLLAELTRRPAGVPAEDLQPHAEDRVEVAVDRRLALDHHAAQLLVLLARLHLQRRARVALEVADLLGLGERP